ncbi:carboxylating nicotinate-nucleotide diphosphorylase [uncultured Ilyobacter sp.]|uniref:carboxylating nicotinate-nucleotide diphosphorylase n=1 Tax=uncultured Ilyobacter sp. TaxID=544433 RepID=UPI0029C835E3|nr:carboxylating nicotinate-nucleotide diphosphorylase [uncultured Ilyobacter sp.]
MNYVLIDSLIKKALLEDRAYDDITTNSITSEESQAEVEVIVKEDGKICGLKVFSRVFQILGDVEIKFLKKEGEIVNKGELIAQLRGSTRVLLSGERVALNLLQRMSGIATEAYKASEILKEHGIKVMDTRKTTPGLRYLEKYSVLTGGGFNHRFDLSDMAMIKDNHILAAGSIKKAVESIRKKHPFIKKIEVEAENLEHVKEGLEAGADIIMLDNMEDELLKECVDYINGRAIIEVSGNIDIERFQRLKGLKIDYISMGKLTHSVKALDISMKNLKILKS